MVKVEEQFRPSHVERGGKVLELKRSPSRTKRLIAIGSIPVTLAGGIVGYLATRGEDAPSRSRSTAAGNSQERPSVYQPEAELIDPIGDTTTVEPVIVDPARDAIIQAEQAKDSLVSNWQNIVNSDTYEEAFTYAEHFFTARVINTEPEYVSSFIEDAMAFGGTNQHREFKWVVMPELTDFNGNRSRTLGIQEYELRDVVELQGDLVQYTLWLDKVSGELLIDGLENLEQGVIESS